MAQQPWEQRAKEKRDSIISLIPSEWLVKGPPPRESQPDVTGAYIHNFLTAQEITITETDALNIARKTTTGAWSAIAVTKAFCHRAALAHQLTNCLLEIFFEQAYARACELDAYYAAHKKPMGPLHGVPISLKDQFHVKGLETSMGYVGWLGTFQGQQDSPKFKTFESEMVRELLSLGAVLYVKTSVPHSLMTGETVNNIVGYAWNPKNRHLSPGGSSGGEGALIGLRGSPLGFGTDIGGSIRIPAAANGLYGIRPSAGRLPYEGMANSMDGQNSILSVVGPLATSAQSLKFIFKALLSTKPWLHDPLVHEIPWRDHLETQALDPLQPGGMLSFGIIRHDGQCGLHPPMRRALDKMTRCLETLGHQVLPWDPTPSHKTLIDIAHNTWDYDGGADVQSAFALSGEPMSPQVSYFSKSPVVQADASHIAKVNVAKREAQKGYMEYWNSTADVTATGRSVDAVISPVAPFAGARPGLHKYVGYTMWVNTLDYTSVVVPVTNVDKDVDNKDDLEKMDFVSGVDKFIQEGYDPDVYEGTHVSLQLVGRRLQEEKMIALADYVGKALAEIDEK